jgi:hypothetical protein
MMRNMKNISQAIAAKINENMLCLNDLQTQIITLKTELEQFLTQYFTNISQHIPEHLLINSLTSANPTSQEYANNFETIIKQLYRSLAKHFHPDLSNGNSSNMQMLNEAYKHKQLGTLMLLESEIGANNEILKYSFDDLLHYHELVQTSLNQAEKELAELQQSDAMRLKNNILLARLNGYDIIRSVADKLQQKHQPREQAA